MRFGVREICNVVLRAKSALKLGKKIFYKNEPVMYFDTLKTSSLEGQSSTVYAQGGRGNPRLVAWEGERTVTFTMEDALISPEGLSILVGAGLIGANNDNPVYQHMTEVIDVGDLDFGATNNYVYKYVAATETTSKKWIIDGTSTIVYEWVEVDDDPETYEWVYNSNSGAPLLTSLASLDASGHPDITIAGNLYDGFMHGRLGIPLSYEPYLPTDEDDNFAYVMFMKNGEIITEPYIPVHGDYNATSAPYGVKKASKAINAATHEEEPFTTEKWYKNGFKSLITIKDHENYIFAKSYEDIRLENHAYIPEENEGYTDLSKGIVGINKNSNYDVREFPFIYLNGKVILEFDSIFVDYYVKRTEGATQIEITADKFGGNYYLEAETLFRTQDGLDLPANFVIPNCKVQSNFTFNMNNTGDPSTFNFTMDAFPDYTRFDHTHKVFAAILIIEDVEKEDLHRHSTGHEPGHDDLDWF